MLLCATSDGKKIEGSVEVPDKFMRGMVAV